jgi:hypothetical protein
MRLYYLTSIFLLFFVNITFSQFIDREIEMPNYVESNNVLFYKNSWKPFSGNVKIKSEFKNHKVNVKAKFINGFCVLEEVSDLTTKKNLLVVFTNYDDNRTTSTYDSLNLKSSFKNNDKFVDSLKVRNEQVQRYFSQNEATSKIEKLNGYVKFDTKKLYYNDGMVSKIEYYYDEECLKIKESYHIFKTSIGNVLKDINTEIYDSNINEFYYFTFDGIYKKWNIEGMLIETGQYKEGKKIK